MSELKDDYRFFKLAEFDSPDLPGSGRLMDGEIVGIIDLARARFMKPITVNSGFRTLAHNRLVGGVADSAHLKGSAIDIKVLTSADRFKLVRILMLLAVHRIGIYQTFIHIDNDYTKLQDVVWLG